VTVSGISRGAGATGTNADDRYAASSWNTASLDATAYFTFTIGPIPGGSLSLTDFVYTAQASGTGPTSFSLRSSASGFATDIGTLTATGATVALTDNAYQNLTAPIEFRLYGWAASAAGGTFSINSFTFNGQAIPEPATTLLGALGLFALLRRPRRD
jgi:hypothetical protein